MKEKKTAAIDSVRGNNTIQPLDIVFKRSFAYSTQSITYKFNFTSIIEESFIQK
jgi:hypothetical protein